MFKFLKEKISNWAKKISKKEKEKAEIVEIAEAPIKEEEVAAPIKEKIKEEVRKVTKEKKEKRKEAEKKFEEEIEKEAEKLEKQSKEQVPSSSVSTQSAERKKKGFFERMVSKISKVVISEEDFEVYSEELEMLLLENNVALEVAEKIIKELKEKIVGKELLKKEVEGEIKDSLTDIIRGILISPPNLIAEIKAKKEKPYVMLFCGINGTGKTTTIAKIANHLKENGVSCVIAAADTFRAASIEQIKKHGDKLGIRVISQDYGSDPAAVAFDAIKYAERSKIDCVLIDTAGRMHTAKNLMSQIGKVAKVAKADAKIFVGESITGNDSIEQVRSFDEAINITGIVLTKADIDEKGGTALSLGHVTKKPIIYLGYGQLYGDIKPFNKEEFIKDLGL